MENGRPRYVTAVGQTDVTDGWRDRRQNGGCVMDVVVELYDVAVLPGVRCPMTLGFKSDEIRRMITIGK